MAVGVLAALSPSAQAGAADTSWTLHTVSSGPRGADGTNLADINGDGLDDVTSAWEEAGLVTVSLHPARGAEGGGPWPTVDVGTHLFGAEDAIFADVDGDGHLDVVSACECRRVVVHFAPADPSRLLDPAAWTSVTLAASVNLQRWIKVALADVDGDGRLDIIGGGKAEGAARPATIGWFRAPADPRDGAAWHYLAMSPVAWTMSIVPLDVDSDGDVDVVMSDRLYIHNPDGTPDYGLRGSRWLESSNSGASWSNHRIGGDPGEHKFLHVVDLDGDGNQDVLDGAAFGAVNTLTLWRNRGGWLSWEATPIPLPAGVGDYQDLKTGDIDLDGDLDLVLSCSHSDGALSGVVWLASTGDGGWERREISGAPGTKYDNVDLADVDGDGDLDVVTSEQIEQLGVIWYENPAQQQKVR